MEENILELIKLLKEKKYTISMMESCTGGELASSITNVSGSSDIFNLGIVTYSNNAKIKFGVEKNIIDKYSVYSKQVAESMAKTITQIANSDFGIGITRTNWKNGSK